MMTKHFLDRIRQSMRLLACICVVQLFALTPVQAASAQVAVGEILLVLGKAFKLDAQGERHRLKAGDNLFAREQILTEASGHVHIKFVDQALVSVRPGSLLEIVRYEFDQQNPARSTVKFELSEGVTRAISGEAARKARERFRLNTPVAAIGVRGTDFVVRATADSTQALVNEGAIVMAPFSPECAVDALGPCMANAIELSDQQLQLAVVSSDIAEPRLLPAPHERDPNGMREEVQLAIAESEESEDDQLRSNEVYLEGVTSTRVTAEVASAETPDEPLDDDLTDFTPAAPVSSVVLQDRQLVWGRWSDELESEELITLSYGTANLDRKVTVGNENYLLFRPETNSTRVEPNLGTVSFALSSAQAFYNSDSGVLAMQVRDGNLDINFVDSAFATDLSLDSALTGAVDFQASGRISDGGYFNSRTAGQTMAGAVSLDGQEAGYFFEKQLQDGAIQGLTLWDAR
jgi:hypothetical protein